MMRVVDVPWGDAGVAGDAIDMHELEQARSEYKLLTDAQRDMLDRLSACVAQFAADRTLRFSNQPFHRPFALRPYDVVDATAFDAVLVAYREGGRLHGGPHFTTWSADRPAGSLSNQAS